MRSWTFPGLSRTLQKTPKIEVMVRKPFKESVSTADPILRAALARRPEQLHRPFQSGSLKARMSRKIKAVAAHWRPSHRMRRCKARSQHVAQLHKKSKHLGHQKRDLRLMQAPVKHKNDPSDKISNPRTQSASSIPQWNKILATDTRVSPNESRRLPIRDQGPKATGDGTGLSLWRSLHAGCKLT